jgi:aspartyl-tRNA(Asn)/glutamyl-tRNA(Gln) amidotransferase subunit A
LRGANIPSKSNPGDLYVFEAAELIRRNELSPVAWTETCLASIQRQNPEINAFITVTAELARQQAREAEQEIRAGHWRGALHGVPLALKDLIDLEGVPTTAASELFRGNLATADAELVKSLKQAGAILVGKTNLHEFAYGASSTVSAFGPVRNPWDHDRIAGGSSGGSAAAVAARLCPAAIGSDTAGSIRLPAACCGVVGFKPTYESISTGGVIPLSWSYDTVGPITRCVRDASLVLEAMTGAQIASTQAAQFSLANLAEARRAVSGLRVGVPREHFYERLEPEVEARVTDALELMAKLTAGLREIRLPVDSDYTVHTSEAYCFHEQYVKSREHLYQPETLRRIRSGEGRPACEYIAKKRDLERIRQLVPAMMQDIDLIVTATMPIVAPTFAELQGDKGELRKKETMMLRNTRFLNVLGLPSISLPCGFSKTGMPIGLQIAGRPGQDATVLAAAYVYEQSTDWHQRPGP